MSKIDDMRRLREQQFAEAEKRKGKAPPVDAAPSRDAAAVLPPVPRVPLVPSHEGAEPEPAQPSRPTRASAAMSKAKIAAATKTAEQGKCPECGKMKPTSQGLLANHQKGFGKPCAGSRKKPV